MTPSNSLRPCAVVAEHRKISGNFSNHPAMRAVNAAMFASTASGVPVRLGEDEDERHGVAREPFHELQIHFLRRQPGLDQREDQAEVRAMLQVMRHRLVEPRAVLLRALRRNRIPADPPAATLFIVKKLMSLVNPGVGETRANPACPRACSAATTCRRSSGR